MPPAVPPCCTSPARRRPAVRRDERGQGTVEYVALILLLALVFAAVVKFGAGKDFDIGKTIVAKLKDAIDGVGEAPSAAGEGRRRGRATGNGSVRGGADRVRSLDGPQVAPSAPRPERAPRRRGTDSLTRAVASADLRVADPAACPCHHGP